MEINLQEQRGAELKTLYIAQWWFTYVFYNYVGEDVREDGDCEKFVSKVIPQNSIRLLNLIGEGMYVCL